jgi:hypothetical protein
MMGAAMRRCSKYTGWLHTRQGTTAHASCSSRSAGTAQNKTPMKTQRRELRGRYKTGLFVPCVFRVRRRKRDACMMVRTRRLTSLRPRTTCVDRRDSHHLTRALGVLCWWLSARRALTGYKQYDGHSNDTFMHFRSRYRMLAEAVNAP